MDLSNKLFKIPLDDFNALFPEEIDCINWLSGIKWGKGFKCHFCGHEHYCSGQHLGSRRCTKCKKEESVKAHTIFENCKLPLKTTMYMMIFAYNNPKMTSVKMCKELGIRKMTCWRMQHIVKQINNKKNGKISK